MSETRKLQLSENGKFDLKAIKTAIGNIMGDKIDHLENPYQREVARAFLSEIISKVKAEYEGLASITPLLSQVSASIAVFEKSLGGGRELETLQFLTGKTFPYLTSRYDKKKSGAVSTKPGIQKAKDPKKAEKAIPETASAKPVIERVDISLINDMKGSKTSPVTKQSEADGETAKRNSDEKSQEEAKSEE